MIDAYMAFRDAFVALDPDHYPADWIDTQVAHGTWRCFGTDKAAILAEIRTYPSGVRELHGIAAAGEVGEIKRLIGVAEHWGRACGATRAVIESRPAWARLLPDYELHQVAVRKDL